MIGLGRSRKAETEAPAAAPIVEAPPLDPVAEANAAAARAFDELEAQRRLVGEAEGQIADLLAAQEHDGAPLAELRESIEAAQIRLRVLRRPLPDLEGRVRQTHEAAALAREDAERAAVSREAMAAVDRAHACAMQLEALAPQVADARAGLEAARAELAALYQRVPGLRVDSRNLLDHAHAAKIAIGRAAGFVF